MIIYDVVKTDGFLKFEFQGYAKEDDHLKNREGSDDYDEIQKILRLQKEGKSIRQIAEDMDMASTTVYRRLKKAEKEGITLEEVSTESVPPVPSVPSAEQVEQTEHAHEMKLPYKD